MTDEQLDYLILQHTGLTAEQHPEAYGKAYRLAFAVMTATHDEDTAHLLSSPANAKHLERSLEQLAAGEATERALIPANDDLGDTPQYRALQAIIDDLIDNAPAESLEDEDTPEGLMLSCLGDAMIRYEKKYWLVDGSQAESRKEFPSPAGKDRD